MNGPPAAPAAIDIRNRLPLFGWVFMAVFLGFTAIFTTILGRDGPPRSMPAPLMHVVLGCFWIVGIAAAGYFWSIPVTRLTQAPDGSLHLISRTPLRRRVETLPRDAIAAIELVQDRDSDGDPYWRTEIRLADGGRRMIREGHDRAAQETLVAGLRATLGLPQPPRLARAQGGKPVGTS